MDTFPTLNQVELEEEQPSPSDVAKKPKRFRMQGKSFTLTYPQCATKKEVAAERIEKQWGGTERIHCIRGGP